MRFCTAVGILLIATKRTVARILYTHAYPQLVAMEHDSQFVLQKQLPAKMLITVIYSIIKSKLRKIWNIIRQKHYCTRYFYLIDSEIMKIILPSESTITEKYILIQLNNIYMWLFRRGGSHLWSLWMMCICWYECLFEHPQLCVWLWNNFIYLFIYSRAIVHAHLIRLWSFMKTLSRE